MLCRGCRCVIDGIESDHLGHPVFRASNGNMYARRIHEKDPFNVPVMSVVSRGSHVLILFEPQLPSGLTHTLAKATLHKFAGTTITIDALRVVYGAVINRLVEDVAERRLVRDSFGQWHHAEHV